MNQLTLPLFQQVNYHLMLCDCLKDDITRIGTQTSYVTHYISAIGEILMAGKGKSQWSGNNFPKIDFVNHKLTVEQKEEFNAWLSAKSFDSDLEIADVLQRGWKLSLSFDNANDVFIGSATQKRQGDANENICVSSRYDSASTALLCTIFKIAKVYRHNAIPREDKTQDFG